MWDCFAAYTQSAWTQTILGRHDACKRGRLPGALTFRLAHWFFFLFSGVTTFLSIIQTLAVCGYVNPP